MQWPCPKDRWQSQQLVQGSEQGGWLEDTLCIYKEISKHDLTRARFSKQVSFISDQFHVYVLTQIQSIPVQRILASVRMSIQLILNEGSILYLVFYEFLENQLDMQSTCLKQWYPRSVFLNIKETAGCYKQIRKHPFQNDRTVISVQIYIHFSLILFPVKKVTGIGL